MAAPRIERASLFMAAGWAGLGFLVLTLAIAPTGAPQALGVAGVVAVIVSSYVMLATRRADEYTEGLWNAGASLAFATMLLTFVGLPLAEGVHDGATGADDSQDIPAAVVPVLAIFAFYTGLFWKRLRGGA